MRKAKLRHATVLDALDIIAEEYRDLPALQIKIKENEFRTLSYAELKNKAEELCSSLIKLGIEKHDRVAILSENRPEWGVTFFGIILAAASVVTLDAKLSEKEIEYILLDCQATCIFVSQRNFAIVSSMIPRLPHLKHVILLDAEDSKKEIHLQSLDIRDHGENKRTIEMYDTILIVYTSGTTGFSKGVEITSANIMSQVLSLSEMIPFPIGENFLSLLPLSHMLEITCGFFAPLCAGCCITYCLSLKPTNIIPLMAETKTTVMICVPLILKLFYEGILKEVRKASFVKQKLFYGLLTISEFLLKFNIRIGKLFFAKVHRIFGGAIKFFVSGGAPLDIHIEKGFSALGFKIIQGYGLTETAPVISVNPFARSKYGSIGSPIPGVKVKILKDHNSEKGEGEIIVKGPNVMKGYFRNSDRTSEMLKDGWLYTGDVGWMDDEGYLYISGRRKNLIVLGTGKKVFPEEVEEVVSKSPYIKEVCIVGKLSKRGVRAGSEQVHAVIVPDLEEFAPDEACNKAFVRKKIASEIKKVSKGLTTYKHIVDFDLYNDELPKTATKKIRRQDVLTILCNGNNKDVFY